MLKVGLIISCLIVAVILCSCSQQSIQHNLLEAGDEWTLLTDKINKNQVGVLAFLKKEKSDLYHQLVLDSQNLGLFKFWGKSLNFDSNAKKIIVEENVLKELHEFLGVDFKGRVVHAGVTHTYGYLLSNLETPYGKKRSRWIRPTLNQGFGLKGQGLAPGDREGTLLSNLTYFIGHLAFQEPKMKAAFGEIANDVSAEIKNYPYETLSKLKITEEVILKNKGVFKLETTLVKFPFKVPYDENAYLLIYSAYTPYDFMGQGRLITAFPINQEAFDKLIVRDLFGEKKSITLKYNAFIDDLMDKELSGKRELSTEESFLKNN